MTTPPPVERAPTFSVSLLRRKLWLGLLLHCPVCEEGQMFSGLFQIRALCLVCQSRFERREGESIGGTLINLCLAEVLTITGIIITQVFWNPPLAIQLGFWISFNILFVIFFYRHARAIWVAITYLTGGVYPDEAPPSP
jgi:uncharacterized protein (DUF983 family)